MLPDHDLTTGNPTSSSAALEPITDAVRMARVLRPYPAEQAVRGDVEFLPPAVAA